MHLSEGSTLVLELHVFVSAGASHHADHVGHDVSQRDLERQRLDRIHHMQVHLGEHFELIPLPHDGAPIALAAQSDQVLLFVHGREGTGQELLTDDGKVLHIRLWQCLFLLACPDLVDGDLGAWLRLLTVSYVTS